MKNEDAHSAARRAAQVAVRAMRAKGIEPGLSGVALIIEGMLLQGAAVDYQRAVETTKDFFAYVIKLNRQRELNELAASGASDERIAAQSKRLDELTARLNV